jgi:hypothetical protein
MEDVVVAVNPEDQAVCAVNLDALQPLLPLQPLLHATRTTLR